MHIDVRLKEFASLGVWGSSFEKLAANLNPNSCCCTCYCGLIMISCNNRAKGYRYLPRSSNAVSVDRLAEDKGNRQHALSLSHRASPNFRIYCWRTKLTATPNQMFLQVRSSVLVPTPRKSKSRDWWCEFENKKREIESTKHQQLYIFTFSPACNSFWPRIFQPELWGPPGKGIKGASQWKPHIAALQLHIRRFYECQNHIAADWTFLQQPESSDILNLRQCPTYLVFSGSRCGLSCLMTNPKTTEFPNQTANKT